jgi:PAS domain S-box-containing protein
LPLIANKKVILQSVAAFAALCAGTIAIFYYVYQEKASYELRFLQNDGARVLEMANYRRIDAVTGAVSDVQFLSAGNALKRWLASGSLQARNALAQRFLNLMKARGMYAQVRLIGLNGREIVRVDWNRGKPAIIPPSDLQNKADRYYVRETLKLGAGQVYLSPFDLNVEHGEIQVPETPVIRIATPVFDETGRKSGMVIVNYLGRQLLESLQQLRESSPGDLWLLNPEGYWLLGPPDDEWAFMYPDRRDRTFARAYPDAWNRILQGPDKGRLIADGDAMNYIRVTLPTAWRVAPQPNAEGERTPPTRWFMVSRVSGAVLAAARQRLIHNYVPVAGTLLLLLALGTVVVTYYRLRDVAARGKLHASEERFRTMVEAAPDAVVISDANGRIVFTNAQVDKILGYSPEELVGQPVEKLIPSHLHARHVDHRTGYMKNPTIRRMGADLDLSAVRADGTTVPVDIGLGFVDSHEGRLVIASIRDVSETVQQKLLIEQYSQKLARDNVSLAALIKELEAFSYSVSHDLRAPLRAIDGFTEALVEDYADKLDDTGRDYAVRVRKGTQRMGMLIDDLLTLSRITRKELKRQTVDLSAVAREISGRLRTGEPARDVEFCVEEGLKAEGDAGMLRIALENLLNNAWKFTKGRAPSYIEFGHREIDGGTAYFVRDNGAGFDMAHADKLFGAFQRLHSDREFPGTGIGLATVQRIINKHGGRIWSEAEVGEGATFYFTLQSLSDSAFDDYSRAPPP